MRMKPWKVLALCLAWLFAGSAHAQPRGELRCNLGGGFGFAVFGQRGTTCVYYRPDGWVEFYIGDLSRLGLDLGPSNPRSLAFAVVTRGPLPPGALAGQFAGVGAGATIGAGVAADALVGGPGQAVEILPIDNSRLTGLNIEAGVGALSLRFFGAERRH